MPRDDPGCLERCSVRFQRIPSYNPSKVLRVHKQSAVMWLYGYILAVPESSVAMGREGYCFVYRCLPSFGVMVGRGVALMYHFAAIGYEWLWHRFEFLTFVPPYFGNFTLTSSPNGTLSIICGVS